MTRLGALSLSAVLAAFIAVTPFVGRHENSRTERNAGAHPVVPIGGHTRLPGVGMPDTGPGIVPVKPLTVIANATGRSGIKKTRREIDALGNWLTAHHGRAQLALVNGTRTTGLVEPSLIAKTPNTRQIRSPLNFAHKTFRERRGQRLLLTIGPRQPKKMGGAASLWLPVQNGAPVADVIALRDHQVARQPIDPRRPGVIAATAARAVISLAHLREVRPAAHR